MPKDIESEINTDALRKNFLKYTRKAFQLLPKLETPRILDIGCGSGVPTIELAKLSDGEIVGIDIDSTLLDQLNSKIEGEGLSNRVKTEKCSLSEMDFPNESFDIIWAEGVIALIGFKKGLEKWRSLLKLNGFLVLHDDANKLSFKLKKISECGYKLINHFLLPENTWWVEYYRPLENRVKELRLKYKNDPEALKILEKHQNEINIVKKNPQAARSIFFLMQKVN